MKTTPLAVYTDVGDLDAASGVAMLEHNGFRVDQLETEDADVIAGAAAEATALLVGYAPIDAELMDRLPNLRVIALLSRGFDNVDVDAASARGIWVSTVADLATEEVATHAWTLTLALVRRLVYFSGSGLRTSWLDRPDTLPRRLSELTIGVVGLGRTGRTYARYAAAMGAQVIACDSGSGQSSGPAGVTITDLDTVIENSDVLSLHLPLTDETRRIVGADLIARVRDGAYLVNVARGGLIDNAALLAALQSGHIAGAALDVIDPEPPAADDPLFNHPEVLTTPHIAYLSQTTSTGYIDAQAGNAVAWLRDGRPLNPINDPAVSTC